MGVLGSELLLKAANTEIRMCDSKMLIKGKILELMRLGREYPFLVKVFSLN